MGTHGHAVPGSFWPPWLPSRPIMQIAKLLYRTILKSRDPKGSKKDPTRIVSEFQWLISELRTSTTRVCEDRLHLPLPSQALAKQLAHPTPLQLSTRQ